jgi:hypothetical protein
MKGSHDLDITRIMSFPNDMYDNRVSKVVLGQAGMFPWLQPTNYKMVMADLMSSNWKKDQQRQCLVKFAAATSPA